MKLQIEQRTLFCNRKRSIKLYTFTYFCFRILQYNLMVARTDKLRAMERAKGQRKEQKRRQKLAFVNEYIGQIHRSSQILGCPKSFFHFTRK